MAIGVFVLVIAVFLLLQARKSNEDVAIAITAAWTIIALIAFAYSARALVQHKRLQNRDIHPVEWIDKDRLK